jgi:hypothetical protein
MACLRKTLASSRLCVTLRLKPNPTLHRVRLRHIGELIGSVGRGRLTPRRQDAKMKENVIGRPVVDPAVNVHRELGPGLLETIYEVVLAREPSRY